MHSIRLTGLFGVLPVALAFGQPVLAADDVTFMIDWLPAGDKAAVYYGVEKGMFRDADLDVTIQSGRGSSDVVTKLATGAADVGSAGLAALLQAKAEGEVPVTAVASVYTLQPDAIFTTSDSGVTSLADLVGKTVGTPTFSSSNVVWPLLLEKNGIAADSITLIKADPGALAPMLATGKVAATINWLVVAPTFEGPLAEVGKSLKTIPWSESGFQGYGLSIMASDRMIADRPEVLKRFLAAYEQAQDAAIADPKGAAEALKTMVPEVSVEEAEAQWAASIPLMVNDIQKKDGTGAFDPALLASTWTWVAEAQGIATDALDPASAVNTSFLP